MPRKQVIVSAADIAAVLASWAREDRATLRERTALRTKVNREVREAVKAVKKAPNVSDSLVAAINAAAVKRELEWDQRDLATAEERVTELRRMGAPAEHVLAYERFIAFKRNKIARRLSEVA